MATQRLTKDLREALATQVLRHRFSGEIKKLVEDRAAFTAEVYDDIYRKADREKMAALPDGWLYDAKSLTVKFGDLSHGYQRLDFNGSVGNGALYRYRAEEKSARPDVWRRAFHKHYHGCWKVYSPDHKLSIRWDALHRRECDLLQRIRDAEKQLEASLARVSTMKSLLTEWPEIEPLVKPLIAQPAARVPALPIARLNEMFKLPVVGAA